MRLLLISFAVVLISAMLFFAVRLWGLAMPFTGFEHEFTAMEKPFLAVRIETPAQARAVLDRRKSTILWFDVPAPEADGKIPRLSALLSEFPEARFILNVPNVTDIDLRLVEIVEDQSPDQRLLIQSDANTVLRTIKEKKPMWLYGTAWPDLMRLLSFESVWLLPVAPFNGDVFIAPLKIHDRPAFNTAVLEEMSRRQKHVLLGPLNNAEEIAAAKAVTADGYILASPDLMTSF